MKNSILLLSLIFLSACASRSVLPDAKEVKVSRDAAKKDCKEIGKITGVAPSAKAKDPQQVALEDLKREAANKGANFVTVKEYSTYGTAVTGIAYECP